MLTRSKIGCTGFRPTENLFTITKLLLIFTVCDRAFPFAVSRTWNCLPLHVTSASPQQTSRSRGDRGWSRICSAAVSHSAFLFPTAATLFSA